MQLRSGLFRSRYHIRRRRTMPTPRGGVLLTESYSDLPMSLWRGLEQYFVWKENVRTLLSLPDVPSGGIVTPLRYKNFDHQGRLPIGRGWAMDNRFREGLILFPDVGNLDPAPQVIDITRGLPPTLVLNTDPIHKAINMSNGLSGPPAIWPHHPHEPAHGSRRRRDRCRGGQNFALKGTGLGRHHYNRAGDNAAGSKLDAPEDRLVPKPSPTPKAPDPKPAASALSGELASSTPWSIIVVLIVAACGLLWLLLKRRP